jgi:hypothetical protein
MYQETQATYGRDYNKTVNEFIGRTFDPYRTDKHLHSRIYGKPSWEAWTLADGRVLIKYHKTVADTLILLDTVEDFWKWERAQLDAEPPPFGGL